MAIISYRGKKRMEIRQVSIVAEKFKSKPTAIIQIFTGTSAKEVGDSDANYEMTDRERYDVCASLSLC